MPSINGTDFNNISSLNGVSWNSVTNIGGVSVSHGPTCTSVWYGYSDGRRFPVQYACTASQYEYAFGNDGVLYYAGSCGTSVAIAGYYSDGRMIYFWDGASNFTPFQPCGR